MHYPIRIIVEAEDKEEALSNAEYTANSLVESDDFDNYSLDGRWGESEGHRLSSSEGRKLVESGMEATRQEFDDAMNHVRYIVQHFTDDQIYSETFERAEGEELPEGIYFLSRWQFGRASGGAHQCYVYGSGSMWGGPIESDRELKVVTQSKENLWVVLVDFHS